LLVQVATCSASCALASAPLPNMQPAKQSCSCCPSGRTSQESPSEQGETEDCGVCFCNSGASTSVSSELGLILDSHAIWTVADSRQPLQEALDSTTLRTSWLPGDDTGLGLRLAVHSLLL
jgi:hypothetical protein